MIELCFSLFSVWVFFHKHSRFTGKLGKGGLSLSLLSTTSTSFTDTSTLAWWFLPRSSRLYTYPAAWLELGTFGSHSQTGLETKQKHWPEILASLAKWLSVCLRTKWLRFQIPLLSLKLQISCLVRIRSSLIFRHL